MQNTSQVVLVTSPPMRERADALLRQYFPTGTQLNWMDGDLDARAAIRARLFSEAWRLCISFYNDYIFSREEIGALGCVVNIHPALPELRGRGYDILPLLDNHREHGATLHFVDEAIDAGEIIEVISQRIPPFITYPEFRARNQELSLVMLERLLRSCQNAGMADLGQYLKRKAASSNLSWSGDFVNSEKLACILQEFRDREPDNLLLRDVPRTLERGLSG